MSGKLYTVREAAKELTLSESTLRTWIFNKVIEVVRIGGAVRIKQSTIDKLKNGE